MKKHLLSLAFLLMAFAAPAQSFSSLSLQRVRATDRISFSVKSETNIRYYLVEGSRDSLGFDILGRVEARCYGRLPGSYSITLYDTSYSFYRLRQVDMMAAGYYSACIAVHQPVVLPAIDREADHIISSMAITGNR